jgi:hypothetical protein
MLTRSALFLLSVGTLLAQGNGTIHGTVTDPAGAAVPGAKVVAVLDERELSANLRHLPRVITSSHRSPSARTQLR